MARLQALELAARAALEAKAYLDLMIEGVSEGEPLLSPPAYERIQTLTSDSLRRASEAEVELVAARRECIALALTEAIERLADLPDDTRRARRSLALFVDFLD